MKSLSIIIPVYNEAKRVKKTLLALDKFQPPKGVEIKKIRFVNDGSTDNTLSILTAWQKKAKIKPLVEIVSYEQNRGRGFAVRLALGGINTDYAMYLDGDMSIPLENLSEFSKYMQKDFDLIFGSKKKPGAKATPSRNLTRVVVGYIHSALASLLLLTPAWDFQGGFKMFSRRFIEQVIPLTNIDRWGFDMETIYLARKLDLKTTEIPVVWNCIENGTKVKLAKDIKQALVDMFQIKLASNYQIGSKPLLNVNYKIIS